MTAQFLLSAITVMMVRVSLNLHLGRETSLQSRSSVLDHWSVQPGSQNWTCSLFPLIAWVFRERLLLFDISSNAASSRTPAPAPRVSLALQRWCQMAVQLSHQCVCSSEAHLIGVHERMDYQAIGIRSSWPERQTPSWSATALFLLVPSSCLKIIESCKMWFTGNSVFPVSLQFELETT